MRDTSVTRSVSTSPQRRSFVLVLAVSMITSASSRAEVFSVEFLDRDGPHWFGTVDTIKDTLTITSWTENSGGIQFWTPAAGEFPLQLSAIDDTLARFDVPDDWNGTIDSTWLFLHDKQSHSSQMNWANGFYSSGDLWFGWGGGSVGTKGLDAVDASFTEASFGEIPFESIPSGFAALSTADTVTVMLIPEPRATIAQLSVAGLLLAAIRLRRDHFKPHRMMPHQAIRA